jgi:hypothetical protein
MGPVCAEKSGFTGGGASREMRDFHDARVEEDTTLQDGLVLKREPRSGKMDLVKTNVPHLVVHHSPTGFEWGYAGSGPADLALNIVHFFAEQMSLPQKTDLSGRGFPGGTVECFEGEVSQLAWDLHMPFKEKVVAEIEKEGTRVEASRIRRWLDQAAMRGFGEEVHQEFDFDQAQQTR